MFSSTLIQRYFDESALVDVMTLSQRLVPINHIYDVVTTLNFQRMVVRRYFKIVTTSVFDDSALVDVVTLFQRLVPINHIYDVVSTLNLQRMAVRRYFNIVTTFVCLLGVS